LDSYGFNSLDIDVIAKLYTLENDSRFARFALFHDGALDRMDDGTILERTLHK